ncbi:MAG: M20/M25/M40 family metallo-hydrolase [Oscillospiraceae bacterium]|jgi:carboxypeptidase PM20D1|nr:M20/M25/M40 family metallo-hydrolase [Oscillospiraceae bacterium]
MPNLTFILFFQICLLLCGAFVLYTVVKAALFTPKREEHSPLPEETADAQRIAAHLSGAIQIATISRPNKEDVDWGQFKAFRSYLQGCYPKLHATLERQDVSDAALLFYWKGTNPALQPMALLSHQDVVPVSSGTEGDWVHPPFSGYNDGEYIWGRGALDMKNHLICVCEAVEDLITEGFQPERDVYLLFGHDEEVMGAAGVPGAVALREALVERGVTELHSTLDEGGAMISIDTSVLKGVLAGVGVAEKGYVSVAITIPAKGGHSSQPPSHSALGDLAKVITRLERHQFKAKMTPLMSALLDSAGRRLPYYLKLVACNHKLLRPLLLAVMKRIPASACMIRTTTAVTQCSGSPADNVLPQKATAVVNFRLMPGTTAEDVLAHIRKVGKNKKMILETQKCNEASGYAAQEGSAFETIERLAEARGDDVIFAPYLVMGGTDSRYYEPICKHSFRFSPFQTKMELITACHGTNERCPVAELPRAVGFFKAYVRQVSRQ